MGKNSLHKSLKSLLKVSLCLMAAVPAMAQNNTNTPKYGFYQNTTFENKVPFANTDDLFERAEMIYKPTDLKALAGGAKAPSGNITKVYIRTKAAAKVYNVKNVVIKLGQTTDTTYDGNVAEPAFKGGTTEVFNKATYTVSTPGWIEFVLTTPFKYDNTKNLVFEISGDEGFNTLQVSDGRKANWGKKNSAKGNHGMARHEFGFEVTFPTSVDGISGAEGSMLYPNPATAQVHLSLADAIDGLLTITDLNGRTMLTEKLSGKEHNFSVASFANGVYYYTIYNANNSVTQTGKLTVAH